MKILGMGNALVDVLARLEDDKPLSDLNLLKGGMELINEEKRNHILSVISELQQRMTAGGSASNTMAALAKMGAPVGFIGKVGDDDYGNFYMEDVRKVGVNTHLIQKQAASGTAMALISPDGERTFGTYLGISAELSVDDLSEDTFSQYNYFYIEGYLVQNYELIESAMRLAKNMGMKVVIDAASYNVVENNLDFFWKLINEYVDVIFANEEEAKALTGLEAEGAVKVLAEKVDIAVVKTGAKGALVMCGDQLVSVPAMSVNLIDTTAAGDYYAAGFLFGLTRNKNLEQCAQLGILLASNVIEVVGTRLDDYSWQKIKQTAEKIISSQNE